MKTIHFFLTIEFVVRTVYSLTSLWQVHIYLSEVLEWYSDLRAQQKWDEKTYSQTRKKLLSALESISGYNPEALLKRLPADALYEERAILLGKMNQHELALSLYVHKVVSVIYGLFFMLYIFLYNYSVKSFFFGLSFLAQYMITFCEQLFCGLSFCLFCSFTFLIWHYPIATVCMSQFFISHLQDCLAIYTSRFSKFTLILRKLPKTLRSE